MWVLRIKPGSSIRTASVLNHYAISPVPHVDSFCLSFKMGSLYVSLAVLELVMETHRDLPAPGIKGMRHHTWLILTVFRYCYPKRIKVVLSWFFTWWILADGSSDHGGQEVLFLLLPTVPGSPVPRYSGLSPSQPLTGLRDAWFGWPVGRAPSYRQLIWSRAQVCFLLSQRDAGVSGETRPSLRSFPP